MYFLSGARVAPEEIKIWAPKSLSSRQPANNEPFNYLARAPAPWRRRQEGLTGRPRSLQDHLMDPSRRAACRRKRASRTIGNNNARDSRASGGKLIHSRSLPPSCLSVLRLALSLAVRLSLRLPPPLLLRSLSPLRWPLMVEPF